MSEYQYYEFQAVDRPLSADERAKLRAISSRATITANSFVNVYHYGDLKARPLEMLERYFDLFVYAANWGTREFAMRVPRRLVDMDALPSLEYLGDWVSIHDAGEHVIISLSRDELDTEYFDEEWDDGRGYMAALAPLRSDLLAGDLQLFSLLWLMQLEWDDFPDDAVEPAPGLTHLSGGLAALVDFLQVDSDLVKAAIGSKRRAPVSPAEPSTGDVEAFVRSLPEDEKIALLVRVCSGSDPHVGTELRRRCQDGYVAAAAPAAPARAAPPANCGRQCSTSRKSGSGSHGKRPKRSAAAKRKQRPRSAGSGWTLSPSVARPSGVRSRI